MPLSTGAENYALDQLGANKMLYASLHTAYSTTGTSEVTGGSYARQAATWSSASSGSKALTTTLPSFPVPACTVEYVGFWDASTSGNFQGMFPNGGASPFGFTATTGSSTFTAPGSSYTNGTTVVLLPAAGSALPTGTTAGTIYTVTGASGDTFTLSGVTVSADGSGTVAVIAAQVFAAPGTFALTSGSITF